MSGDETPNNQLNKMAGLLNMPWILSSKKDEMYPVDSWINYSFLKNDYIRDPGAKCATVR